jgi:hypothetical protein
MKKGIIMEIKRDILVMMTPEGEFLTGRKQPDQQYAVGEEIPFFPLQRDFVKSKPLFKWNWRVSTSLFTALVVLIALFSSTMLQNNRAYAYVSVDINPSMELTLNKEKQVLKIKPFNDDARVLLKELSDWENEDVGEVTEKIFLLSERLGYLKDNQNVFITSSFIDDSDLKRENELLDVLTEFVQEYSSEHHTNIVVKETSSEFREKASEKGMTAGSLIRKTEQKNTIQPIEPSENHNKVIKKEKENQKMNQIEEPKIENQKMNPPAVENKQNADKSEPPRNKHTDSLKLHPGKNEEKEKPVKSQNGNSSNGNKWRRDNDRSNRGHNDPSYREKYDNRDIEKHNHHQNRKEVKKDNHEERKGNKKD